MDEVAYLDHLRLDVVDRPPGVSSTPDERFAPEGPRPTGRCSPGERPSSRFAPTDLEGRDVTETLRHWDRRTVDALSQARRLDRLRRGTRDHPRFRRPAEPLTGRPTRWCSAWRAGSNTPIRRPITRPPRPASLSSPRRSNGCGDDGSWETIEPHAGYPAGMPRLMTLDLTGKLTGPRCVLRIKTNMECYYDQAFIAVRDRAAETSLRVTTLPVARAVLGYRGYTREISPDGRAAVAFMTTTMSIRRRWPAFRASSPAMATWRALLQSDDDQLCLVGPGDEVQVEFEASDLPVLPPGWTRSYVLRSVSVIARTPTRSPPPATTVEPLPCAGCRRSRSTARSSGRAIRLTNRTCAPIRPGRRRRARGPR